MVGFCLIGIIGSSDGMVVQLNCDRLVEVFAVGVGGQSFIGH